MMVYVNTPKYVVAQPQIATFSKFTGVVAAVKPMPKTTTVQMTPEQVFESSLRQAAVNREIITAEMAKAQFNALFAEVR